ncbi:hypothetical protein [Methanobrevibacter sp.]
MRSNFIQEYERNLVESAVQSAVESAVESAVKSTAEIFLKNGYDSQEKDVRDEILKATGVDIFKK